MAEKKISYLNRTFEDYRDSLKTLIATYYPDIANDFDDASIGSWLIDLVAAIGDNLSYHIDSMYTETNLDTARQLNSLKAIARTNGLKIPGPKGAMAELRLSVILPVSGNYSNGSQYPMPNYFFAPIIKKGTRFRAKSGEYFELMDDVDFNSQFNNDGVSDRIVEPYTDSNSIIQSYRVTKTNVVVIAGQSQIYREVIKGENTLKPFMEYVIPETNVMNVESIIFKTGGNFSSDPSISEFMTNREYNSINNGENVDVEYYRYFEVDNLTEQYRWGDDNTHQNGNQDVPPTVSYMYSYYSDGKYIPTTMITKGMWIPLTQKFITEYTDNGHLKITFGSGVQPNHNMSLIKNCDDYSKNAISKMIMNNSLGKTPIPNSTMYILYRIGGGYGSNVPANTITSISYLNYEWAHCPSTQEEMGVAQGVIGSLSVTNPEPSISGKDGPNADELRYMIKYNNMEQNRCVTVKDYESRVMKMPPRYGCPFRVSATEENNKIMLYLLNIDNNGYLTDVIPAAMSNNIQKYLTRFRTITDFVEIKAGRIINLSFEIDIIIDKAYNTNDVIRMVLDKVKDYMDINKHFLGEDIFVGDIEKEVSKIDGVLNLIDLRVYNNYDGAYSSTITSQLSYGEPTVGETRNRIDLDASDYVLYSEADEMFEVKYPESDIKVRAKTR